ncbi:NOL1 NOP2 sun family [Pyrenophora seminiperda CCB06]|uniref:NOL1 NOP2 sun family n=1 Tax=Pyrenophora seminiperda CCB06 TaxID=1302712 RepID=A0A3M7M8I7_9PLEO|nr:NOL1 NOP2 sun family [Pyrenophora seminiperda CCB06]
MAQALSSHATALMSLYYEAAAILANTDNIGGSLKSRIYNKKDVKSTPGQLFALIAETSKWSIVLKDVIEKCNLLSEERKASLTPILALLLTHDLLLAKNGVAAATGHVLKLAITRHKARLSAELTKSRIRHGYATLDAFRAAVNDGELDKEQGDAPKSRHPRWVRVNTIKTTLEEQLSKTFAEFVKTETLADVLSAPKKSKIYYQDPNIPNLLALPSRIDLSRSFAYTKGQIIFQDKASCFPAHLLDPQANDGHVIDATAAPGNKTTHLAAIVSDRKQPGQEQKIIAFERDKGRTFTLQKMVKLASADAIVQVKGSSDFIATKPGSDEFSNVGAILLDPSCSGTGIVGRDDAIKMHLPAGSRDPVALPKLEKGKKRKRGDEEIKEKVPATLDLDMDDSTPEETPMHGKLAERLAALSSFQLHILTHAMRFESAHKITYSTCSIHFEENEGVVFKALASSIAKERGWKILKRECQVASLKLWHRRGVWEDGKLESELDEPFKQDVLEACIRCDKGTEEGTMGFFVAAFVRDGNSVPAQITEAIDGEDEEWNGFSDHDVVEKADHVEVLVASSSEKRKKKKKKRKQ